MLRNGRSISSGAIGAANSKATVGESKMRPGVSKEIARGVYLKFGYRLNEESRRKVPVRRTISGLESHGGHIKKERID